MTTSSRKKGILPVRLGLLPDTKTALAQLGLDESLADTMTAEALDDLIIDSEYQRLIKFYQSKNDSEGLQRAEEWKKQATSKARNN